MTNPEIKVKRSRKSKKSATDIQMLIESTSEQQYDIFDKQIIVNSLTRECNMSEHEALSIAARVEETLLKSNFKQVSSSYIRSLINQTLGESGYDAWLKYSSLSIPIYDVKKLVEEHNSENSNTGFSPESINLTLAGQILKQYALREVFDKDVAEGHLKGEYHLHDLDFVNRPYAFDGETSFVNVKNKKTNKEEKISLKDLFLKDISQYFIKDVTGWVDILSLIEIPEEKDIYEIELESGEKLYVTEDHPCLKYDSNGTYEEIQTMDLKVGDLFYVEKH